MSCVLHLPDKPFAHPKDSAGNSPLRCQQCESVRFVIFADGRVYCATCHAPIGNIQARCYLY